MATGAFSFTKLHVGERYRKIISEIQRLQDNSQIWLSLNPITSVNLKLAKEELTLALQEGNLDENYELPYYDLQRLKLFEDQFSDFRELKFIEHQSNHTQVWKEFFENPPQLEE